MKECVVLTGDVSDAKKAAKWAAACAQKANMSAVEAKAVAERVRDHFVKACVALFGNSGGDRTVVLSGEYGNGDPEFQLCTDGAVKCAALGPKCDDSACDGLTCFKLVA